LNDSPPQRKAVEIFRPRSCMAIDRTGDRSGAGGRAIRHVCGCNVCGCLGQAASSTAEAAPDRPQRRSQDDACGRRCQDCRSCPDPDRPRLASTSLADTSFASTSFASTSLASTSLARHQLWLPRRASMPYRLHAKPVTPAAVAATSSTSQSDKDALESVIELVRKHKAADATQAQACDLRSGRAQARGMADPAQRRQWCDGRALSRLPCRQSELALADILRRRLEAALWDDHRDDATVWSWFENEIAGLGQRQVRAGAGNDRARRSRQCRTPWCATPGATTA